MQRIAITGANGFIGQALCCAALAQGFQVVAITRSPFVTPDGIRNFVVGDINSHTSWLEALSGCDVVVHLAAYQPISDAAAELEVCRRVNVRGTENLARQAASAGVRRFVFMSSIKVNGEVSPQGHPFTERDTPAPADAYATSKWEAEQRLSVVSAQTQIGVVVVRPPLVYGFGVRGNLGSLVRTATLGVPLPLSRIRNKRSMVSQMNLISFVMLCCIHPQATHGLFLVSDGEDVSVPELLERIGAVAGTSIHLFPAPIWMLKVIAKALGRSGMFSKLSGHLQVDITKARQELGWRPSHSLDSGLRQLMGYGSL